jgi:membrane associated rhomboid family serine protease
MNRSGLSLWREGVNSKVTQQGVPPPVTEPRPLSREPIFNVPGVVVGMIGTIVALHVLRAQLSDTTDTWLVLALAFIPARYDGATGPLPGGGFSAVSSVFTHMLVHGDLTHLALNVVSLLAFGGIVARRTGGARFFVFTLFCGAVGALTFWAFNRGEAIPMVGASGAIAGMMAVAMRLMFSALDSAPLGLAGEALRRAPQVIPLMPLVDTLLDRRMIVATLVWLGINLLAVFGLAGPAPAGGIAWEAHVGGFAAGLACFGAFDRTLPVRTPPAG